MKMGFALQQSGILLLSSLSSLFSFSSRLYGSKDAYGTSDQSAGSS